MEDPYDSWDIENVQYIRTKSRCNSTVVRKVDCGRLLTHERNTPGRNRRSLSCLYISKNSEQVVGAFSSGSSCGSLNTEVSSTEARKEGILMRIRRSSESISSGEDAGSCRLDDCYVLDVVTVRNESVVVDGKKKRPPPPSKIPVLMRKAKSINTLPTPVSITDCNPKPSLGKARGINASPDANKKKLGSNKNLAPFSNKSQPKALPVSRTTTGLKKPATNSDSKKDSEKVGKPIGKDHPKSQSQLRLDDPRNAVDRTSMPFIPNRSSLLLKLASDDSEGSSVRTSSSVLSELDIALSTSNSSRSDGLYGSSRGEFSIYSEGSVQTNNDRVAYGTKNPPNRSAPEGKLRSVSSQSSNHYGQIVDDWPRMGNWTPTNFGVDKQGQLVIDYSQNWKGLEAYVKKLKY